MSIFRVKPFMVMVAKRGKKLEMIIFNKQEILANSREEAANQLKRLVDLATSFWLNHKGVRIR